MNALKILDLFYEAGIEPNTIKEKPVRIEVHMSNSSGIFQIQELLQRKLRSSNLDQYIEVVAKIKSEEKRILKEAEIKVI